MPIVSIPRIFIASHKGGAGKTLFTLGLVHLLQKKGFKTAVYKKGPDYIDAGWLSKVSKSLCRNLDLFLFDEKLNLYSFYQGIKHSDIAIIEGNRGLFDGMDYKGTYSSSRLAKLLKSPIILILDCTKVSRSIAALVKGFLEFEKDISIKGVVLNKIARKRHADTITKAIEYYTGVPILGVIYKLQHTPPKERHLGLITSFEVEENKFLDELILQLEENCDWHKIIEIAKEAPHLEVPEDIGLNHEVSNPVANIKIGVFKDKAFQFYYPENLESLAKLGAQLVYINALEDKDIEDVDALYIGGGFPEVQAEKLAENENLRNKVKLLGEEGMPIYAECGGFMYLGKEIKWQGKSYPMCGILPFEFIVEKKPQGHGYVIAEVIEDNPYFEKKQVIKGHEFHYSQAKLIDKKFFIKYIFKIKKGFGINGEFDGVLYKNILASYLHIHVFSVKNWVINFLKLIDSFKKLKKEV